MLAFIDESGLPNPKDKSTNPVVVAVCYDERHSCTINGRIYAIQRGILHSEQVEVKGTKYLSENAYLTDGEKWLFAQRFFSELATLPITVFATIMQNPFELPMSEENQLGDRFRFLLQRIDLLANECDASANILFDGRGRRFHKISRYFYNYLYRTAEGQACIHISDTPEFVDSKTSTGIQIADMCAYMIRVYQENWLFLEQPSHGNEYLHAIGRWYRIIERLTRNLSTSSGANLPGLYRLPAGAR